MSPLPVRDCILGALRLRCMTIQQIATCLSQSYGVVQRELSLLHDEGLVIGAGMFHRQQLHGLRP